MIFNSLPHDVKKAVIGLTRDEVFQARFKSDKILDSLDEEKDLNYLDINVLQTVLGFKTEFKFNDKKIEVNPITPAMWAYLWYIKSPFVNTSNKINEADLSIFLYLLEYGIIDSNPTTIASKAFKVGYKIGDVEVTPEAALQIVSLLIKIAFRPLALFPRSGKDKEKTSYDADWLTSIVARTHDVTGLTPDHIMFEMPLASCCSYFVQYARNKGVEGIYKRSEAEILELYDERCCELICDRLIELKVIQVEDKCKYIEMIKTKKNLEQD